MSLTYSQAKECIEALDRLGLEQLIDRYSEEVIDAAFACGIQPADIEEAYQGEWASDEAFVKNLLEDIGALPEGLPSYVHVDWTSTARDVMMDYSTDNGHYFRNL